MNKETEEAPFQRWHEEQDSRRMAARSLRTTESAIISRTGKIHGRGSDRFKTVSHLTAEERSRCRAGELILVRDLNRHPSTTEFKEVVYVNGRYTHRNYTGPNLKTWARLHKLAESL